MAKLISLSTNVDERGRLTVIDQDLPFDVKRVFYIYDVKSKRGGHGHYQCQMALIALNGSVEINVQSPLEDYCFTLSSPDLALVLKPEDWHEMVNFSKGSILLVLCSHHYDKEDYFFTPYR